AGLSALVQRNAPAPHAFVTAAPLATSPIARSPIATPASIPKTTPAALATSSAPASATIRVPSPGASSSPIVRLTPGAHRVQVATSPLVVRAAPIATALVATMVPPYAITAAPRSVAVAPRIVTAAPAPPAPVQPTDEADSDFARLSAGVVRFY